MKTEKYISDFPTVSDVDMIFGGYDKKWFNEVLEKSNDIEHKWTSMFSNLFFHGGKIPINKSLPETYLNSGLKLLKAVMGSFQPKHEHKEQVCGFILKSICENRENNNG